MLAEFLEAIRLMQRTAPEVTVRMQVNRKTLDQLAFELTTSNRLVGKPPMWDRFPAIEILGVYITEDTPPPDKLGA